MLAVKCCLIFAEIVSDYISSSHLNDLQVKNNSCSAKHFQILGYLKYIENRGVYLSIDQSTAIEMFCLYFVNNESLIKINDFLHFCMKY